MMTCRDLRDKLGAWKAGELPLHVRAMLSLHAAMCPCCRALSQTFDTTIELGAELADTVVPDEVAAAFDDMIERAMATPPRGDPGG